MRMVPKGTSPRYVSDAGVGTAGSFSLGSIVVEMRNQSHSERVSIVQTFNYAQITGNLSKAFSETQAAIVHCEGVGIKVAFTPCSVQHLEMINRHLKNLSFL